MLGVRPFVLTYCLKIITLFFMKYLDTANL